MRLNLTRLQNRTRCETASGNPALRVTLPIALKRLTRDAWLLFATRFTRLFAYGSLSVVLVFYLIGLGLSASQTGLLLTLTLAGDTVVSLFLTTRADRIGRRRMLIVGAVLMAGAGIAFASTRNLWLLLLAGTIGVISPSGHEVGPFLSIEQAALSHVVTDRTRTEVFAWYTLAGSLATALGALAGGTLTHALQDTVMTTPLAGRARGPNRCPWRADRCARPGRRGVRRVPPRVAQPAHRAAPAAGRFLRRGGPRPS